VNNLKWGITAAIFAFVVSVFMGIIFEVAVIHIFLRAIIFTVVFFGLGFGLRLAVNNYFPEVLLEDESGGDSYAHSHEEHAQDHSAAGIILDNTGEYAVPELYKTPGDPEEMGNIEDLISGVFNLHGDARSKGVDANAEAGYNSQGGDFSLGLPEEIPFADDEYQDGGYQGGGYQGDADEDAPQERQVFTPAFGSDSDGVGGLPDLDMMARAFGGGGAPAQGPAASAAAAPSASAFVPTIISETVSTQEAPSSSPYKGNKPEPIKGDFNPKELAEGIRSVLSKDK